MAEKTSNSMKQLVAALRQLASSEFSEAMASFRQAINLPSFRMDVSVGELELRTRGEAVRAFGQAGQHFVNKAVAELEKEFAVVKHHDSLFDIDDDLLDSLSIVGDEEIEIDIALSRFIALAEAQFNEQLLQLEVRLEALSLKTVRGINTKALHPGTIIDPFRNQLDAMDLDISGKIILCDEFSKHLIKVSKELYKQANKLLANAGILNDSKALALALRQKKQLDSSHHNSETTLKADPELPHDSGQKHDSQAGYITSTLPVLTQEHITQLNRFLGHKSGTRANPSVMDALTTLQKAALPDNKPLKAEQIRDSLLRHSKDERIKTTRKLPQYEERVIQFFSEVFAEIFNDENIGDTVKALVARLQIPLIKLALTHLEFLDNENHPARELVNEIIALNVCIPDRETPLYNKLLGVINSVTNNYSNDQKVFSMALKQVKQLASEEYQTTRGKEENLIAHADLLSRRKAAKRTVVNALKRHMHSKSMPSEAINFILKCWAPYMTVIYLRHGSDSEVWRRSIMSMKRIVEAAQPQRNLAEINGILGHSKDFIGELAIQLHKVGANNDEQRKLTQNIAQWIEKWKTQKLEEYRLNDFDDDMPIHDDMELPDDFFDDKPDTSNPDDIITEVKLALSEADSMDPDNQSIQRLLSKLPTSIKVGRWYDVYQETSGISKRAKLHSILESTGGLLFSEYSSQKSIEVSIEAFIKQMAAGKSKRVYTQHRFDAAMSKAMESIQDLSTV